MKTIVIGDEYYLVNVYPTKLNGRKVEVVGLEGVDYRCRLLGAQPGDKQLVIVSAESLVSTGEPSTGAKEKPSEKIIERLKKMMAMAARKEGNEAEAAVAAQMAENLMRKYNIEHSDLIQEELRAGGKVTAKVSFQDSDWTEERFPVWMKALSPAVARLFDCEGALITVRNRHPRTFERCTTVAFFGYEVDCEIAVWTFETVVTEINRLADKRWQDHKAEAEGWNEMLKEEPADQWGGRQLITAKMYKNSFRIGCVETVVNRINDMLAARAKEQQAAGPVGTALVVAKKKAIEEEFGEFGYSNGKHRVNTFGLEHGLEDGKTISLNKPVSAPETDIRLLK